MYNELKKFYSHFLFFYFSVFFQKILISKYSIVLSNIHIKKNNKNILGRQNFKKQKKKKKNRKQFLHST